MQIKKNFIIKKYLVRMYFLIIIYLAVVEQMLLLLKLGTLHYYCYVRHIDFSLFQAAQWSVQTINYKKWVILRNKQWQENFEGVSHLYENHKVT